MYKITHLNMNNVHCTVTRKTIINNCKECILDIQHAQYIYYVYIYKQIINKQIKMYDFQVLEQVASRLNYSDLKEFSATHLPFLLTQWLDSDYTFDEFPYQLTGFKSISDFYA